MSNNEDEDNSPNIMSDRKQHIYHKFVMNTNLEVYCFYLYNGIYACKH